MKLWKWNINEIIQKIKCDVFPRGSEDLNDAELFWKRYLKRLFGKAFLKDLNVAEMYLSFSVAGIYCVMELQSA